MIILKSWLEAEAGRVSRLAKHLGVPMSFVSKMAGGSKPIPTHHGAAIEQFTDGAVTRREMFPVTWQRIWPELADTPAANDPHAAQAAQQGVEHV